MFRVTAIAALVVSVSMATAHAQLIETNAKRIHLVDADTGAVLLSREADEPFVPGSIAKLMTAETVFHALAAGELSPEQTFPVSEHAWRSGGAPSRTTTMFAAVKSSVAVSDLIQGLTVQMANDAAIILAEGMAGSEANFAAKMNERARAIGLKDAVFINPTGFPGEGQHVTARETTMLAEHLWRQYPGHYTLFSQPAFEWNRIFQRNKNPLLALNIGADGLMTGFAEGHGYSLVASATDGSRRVFLTIGGLETEAERVQEAARLLQWGLEGFHSRTLLAANAVVGRASVYGGAKPDIALRVEETVTILAPVAHPDAVNARVVYNRPLPAPIEEGAEVGELQVWVGDTLSKQVKLHAAETVANGTLPQRAMGAVAELLVGWLRQFSWAG